MNSLFRKKEFDPSGIGKKNGNFIGLPFTEESANVVLLSVPWDVTVSYNEGTAYAPDTILSASVQLDLYDPDIKDAWKLGIFMQPSDKILMTERNELRPKASGFISFIEKGEKVSAHSPMERIRNDVDAGCEKINLWVKQKCHDLIQKNKLIGLVGGDHSVPLGYLQALAEKYDNFGILQIDAHHDLRQNYEGFHYSHASIFFNALKISSISKLVQVGVRDYCDEEVDFVHNAKERISVFYDQQLKENQFNGNSWNDQCYLMISELPENVYISFDADGLDPKLCPGTGTPVPGGLDFFEINYLLKKLVESGRKIIGFDLCEVGQNEWDANVGARILYKLCNWMGRSQGKI